MFKKKKKKQPYVFRTKGKICLFTFKNIKLSGLTNTHVLLLLTNQDTLCYPEKNRFKTQKHPSKTQTQPQILEKSSSAVLASL